MKNFTSNPTAVASAILTLLTLLFFGGPANAGWPDNCGNEGQNTCTIPPHTHSGCAKGLEKCDMPNARDVCRKPGTCPSISRNGHCAQNGAVTFLFAHGLNGDPDEWDTFVDEIKKVDSNFGIWRIQVKKLGHIRERAAELANFMKDAANGCGTAYGSVVAVGHSMGGLDLRYIVGSPPEHKEQRKLLKAVYTIATPHLGDPNACAAVGGAHDLCGYPDDRGKDSPMKTFNSTHPYADFTNNKIGFKAYWYECKAKKAGEDGVVPIASQKWDDDKSNVPREDGGIGWHKTRDGVQHGCTPELWQREEIKEIAEKYSTKLK